MVPVYVSTDSNLARRKRAPRKSVLYFVKFRRVDVTNLTLSKTHLDGVPCVSVRVHRVAARVHRWDIHNQKMPRHLYF